MKLLHDTFVFGVGRSGTTMVYGFCQKSLSHITGQSLRCVYEPFIWNPELFDRPYEECAALFGKTASVNIEGMFNHLQLPLFMDAAFNLETGAGEFFKRFEPATDNRKQLFKLIRGNGRLRLFRNLNPTAKFIVMIRNPISCVNSVKYKFDYFGSDFYPSDLHRFCEELGIAGKSTMDPRSAGWAQTQAEYVYQMNSAAVEFALNDAGSLMLEYDTFIQDPAEGARKILEFLSLGAEKSHERFLAKPVGPQTMSVSLSKREFDSISNYAQKHALLCELFEGGQARPAATILSKFSGNCSGKDYDGSMDGLVPNALRRYARSLESQLSSIKASN